MASKSPVKMTNKNGIWYLDEGILEYCIWNDYLEKNRAVVSGTKVESFGLLPIRYFKDRKQSAPSWIGTSMIPSMVTFTPSSVDSDQKIKIYPSSEEKPYTIMRFEAGDAVHPVGMIQDLDNVVMFVEMVLNGAIDCNIPYFKLTQAWMNNMLWNGVGLGVPATTLELIIRTLCRYKDDLATPFIFYYAKGKGKVSEVDYRFTSTRTIAVSGSVFAGLSFEDLNYMIDYSLNTTSTGKEQSISPLEQILKL